MAADGVDESLEERIAGRLRKSGFPLEMRVAARIRQSGDVGVFQSLPYVDQATRAIRETDVLATWITLNPSGYTYLSLVIECKSKAQPWVVFDTNRRPVGGGAVFWSATPKWTYPSAAQFWFDRLVQLISVPHYPPTLFGDEEFGQAYGIVELDLSDKPKPESVNGAWNAVRSAVSAAHGILAEQSASQQIMAQESERIQIPLPSQALIYVPVVVTSGKLFRSWLDDDGDVKVAETDRASVAVRLTETIGSTRCIVITESALDALIKQAGDTIDLFQLSPEEWEEFRRRPSSSRNESDVE